MKNCNYCEHLNLTEEQQHKAGTVKPHICLKYGKRVFHRSTERGYHISKHHPLSYDMTETGWTRVEAWGAKTGRRNVLHIMNRERIGQRRGVPFLAPVIEALKQLGRYTDAELVAAVVSGMFTVFIEKESASRDGGFGEIIPEDAQVDAGDDSTIELAPGAIVDLNEGEKAHDMNPGRPNTAFDGFVVAICRQIGAALEIPYELLVKNFNASYSASRGALLEAWKMFRMYRTWLANDFCQPVYEEWFAEAVAKGRIPAPGFFSDPLIRKAYTGAEWNGPAQGLLNPVQEVTAAEKRVQNGFSTRDREAILRKGRRTKMYYCHPYTSCERGSNECANKMIRRKYPKGTDFNKVSRASIKETEAWINNYPREILGWKTSEIVFAEYLEELAREA